MPNEPDVHKVLVATQISCSDNRRLEILAQEEDTSKADILEDIIHAYVRKVTLTAEDEAIVEAQIAANIAKRLAKRRGGNK